MTKKDIAEAVGVIRYAIGAVEVELDSLGEHNTLKNELDSLLKEVHRYLTDESLKHGRPEL